MNGCAVRPLEAVHSALRSQRTPFTSPPPSPPRVHLVHPARLSHPRPLCDGAPRYSCFGYTIDGARLLSDVKEGDLIVSAKVTSGLDRLVAPRS